MQYVLSKRAGELTGGRAFYVRANCYSDRWIVGEVLKQQVYNHHRLIQPTDTVLDLGANIGAYTVYAALRAHAGTVVAVEPLPENVELLRLNIQGLKNVEIIPRAVVAPTFLADSDNCTDFYYTGQQFHRGRLGIFKPKATRADSLPRHARVPIIRIGQLITAWQPTVIKCDIEGAERGGLFMETLWASGAQAIVGEYHCAPRQNTRIARYELAEGAKGYKLEFETTENNYFRWEAWKE